VGSIIAKGHVTVMNVEIVLLLAGRLVNLAYPISIHALVLVMLPPLVPRPNPATHSSHSVVLVVGSLSPFYAVIVRDILVALPNVPMTV